jgi:hypothetical protein
MTQEWILTGSGLKRVSEVASEADTIPTKTTLRRERRDITAKADQEDKALDFKVTRNEVLSLGASFLDSKHDSASFHQRQLAQIGIRAPKKQKICTPLQLSAYHIC